MFKRDQATMLHKYNKERKYVMKTTLDTVMGYNMEFLFVEQVIDIIVLIQSLSYKTAMVRYYI